MSGASLNITKNYITLLGLTNNRRSVVLADNRGNAQGASDNGYAFSKEVIIVWTVWRSLALAEKGIRINCTLPGPTDTPMMRPGAWRTYSRISAERRIRRASACRSRTRPPR